jgi:hypothetical protein
MATHTRGRGTKFYRSNDGGGTWTQIARVLKLKPPGRQRSTYDVSDLDDTDDVFASGNRTPGKMNVTLRFSAEEATQQTLEGDIDSDDAGDYKIEYSDAAEQILEAFIENWDPQEIDRNNDVQVNCEFQCSGDIPLPA